MAKKHELPDLPYAYDALEPVISAEIMQLHHDKHHAAYVANLNKALEQYEKAETAGDVAKMIALQSAIKFNGGGHVNHSLFWPSLASPNAGGGGEPTGALGETISKRFGSFANFQEVFNTLTIGIQGSGWGWLGICPKSKSIRITTCANQDPLSTKCLIPLLGCDVWEHAYYPQYKNVRPDYVKAFWKIVNWKHVGQRFEQAMASECVCK